MGNKFEMTINEVPNAAALDEYLLFLKDADTFIRKDMIRFLFGKSALTDN